MNRQLPFLFLSIALTFTFAYAQSGSRPKDADEKIKKALDQNWEILLVETRGGHMRIQTGLTRINELTYRSMVSATCAQFSKTPSLSKGVVDITVTNKFKRQGYVYEAPGRCNEILKSPLNKVKPLILGSTHLCGRDCW